jgi:hypothetical protein
LDFLASGTHCALATDHGRTGEEEKMEL